MKIYADTSVFGGLFDKEFSSPTRKLFDLIDSGDLQLVTSAVVEGEIECAPENVRAVFYKYAEMAEVAQIDESSLSLREAYIDAEIVTLKSLDDALHVALATISECELIISWNFKHIVHYDKIPKYNAINKLYGHHEIGIFSPLEVIDYDYE